MPMTVPATDATLQRLTNIRLGLLRQHKRLLDVERLAYENIHGRIPTSGAFLQLVIADPWFDWLHTISRLVVQIDERLDNKEPLSADEAKDFLEKAYLLLQPSTDKASFQAHYAAVIERDAAIALAHAELLQLVQS
jgi:hypothetical protein